MRRALLAAVFLLLLSAPPAWGAQETPPESGAAWADYFRRLPEGKRAAARQLIEAHHRAVLETENRLWAKFVQLDALACSPAATQIKIEALTNEIVSLRLQLFDESAALAAELEKATGVVPPSFALDTDPGAPDWRLWFLSRRRSAGPYYFDRYAW
jgi:hypothetical protein